MEVEAEIIKPEPLKSSSFGSEDYITKKVAAAEVQNNLFKQKLVLIGSLVSVLLLVGVTGWVKIGVIGITLIALSINLITNMKATKYLEEKYSLKPKNVKEMFNKYKQSQQ